MKAIRFVPKTAGRPAVAHRRREQLGRCAFILFRLAFLIGMAYVLLFPLLVMLSRALRPQADMYNPSIVWIPSGLTLENFRLAFDALNYDTSLVFTLRIVLISTVFSTVSCSMAGYAIGRYHLRANKLLVGMAVLTFLVQKTKLGKAMRAVSEDMGAAQLMGISLNRTISFTFAVGSALAGIGSVLYICAYGQASPTMGSMLGLNYNEIESNSVGYKTDYEMHSLDFEEFLWASNRADDKDNILSHMLALKPFSPLELDIYNNLFLTFSMLGGMPEVVRNYIERGTFEGSLETQRQILLDYKEDIQKYNSGTERSRILSIFNSITPQLAKENKKFQISKVAKNAKSKDYWGCVTWLEQSGIVRLCHNLHIPELPLNGNSDDDCFKIYFSDMGILIATLDDEAQEDLRYNRNLGIYKGALFENMVADALTKEGYKLFYYKKQDSTLEEDFFIRSRSHLIPIEVKATNGRSKSLSTLIKSERYPDIQCGIKFTGGNIGYSDGIYSFPYFCAFLLKDYLKRASALFDKQNPL